MAQLAPNYNVVGNEFAGHYYRTFGGNRAGLAPLYGPLSMLTFESQQFQGTQSIMEKLACLPVKVVHTVVTCDSQPTAHNGILVVVGGDVSIDGGQPMKFTQTFHLEPGVDNNKPYYIFNDIFRFCLN